MSEDFQHNADGGRLVEEELLRIGRLFFHPIVHALGEVQRELIALRCEVRAERRSNDSTSTELGTMTDRLQRITAAVSRIETIEGSGALLIRELITEVRDLRNAQDVGAAADALADRLEAKADDLAAAIAENTNAQSAGGDTGGASAGGDTGGGAATGDQGGAAAGDNSGAAAGEGAASNETGDAGNAAGTSGDAGTAAGSENSGS